MHNSLKWANMLWELSIFDHWTRQWSSSAYLWLTIGPNMLLSFFLYFFLGRLYIFTILERKHTIIPILGYVAWTILLGWLVFQENLPKWSIEKISVEKSHMQIFRFFLSRTLYIFTILERKHTSVIRVDGFLWWMLLGGKGAYPKKSVLGR